jgi:L-fuculose-phosphate aldolase
MNLPEKYYSQCEELIKVCQRLYQRNMLAAADGNVSIRVDEGIIITPSGKAKGFIKIEDLCLITLDNKILLGNPSSERMMHLKVYNTCPEALAVVHAHPPTAIAWTVAYPEMGQLPNNCLSEIVLAAGEIPIVPYARPGTEEMGIKLLDFLPQNKLLILSRHGALTWGDNLEEAIMGMERLEHSAEILYKAKMLNQLTYIDDKEMTFLYEMRKKIGNKSL